MYSTYNRQACEYTHTHTNRNRHIHYILLCANSSSRHIYTLKGKIGWFMYSWRCFEINWLSCQLCYILVSINNFGSIVMEKKGMRCVFVQFVHDGCYIRQHKEVSWKYIHMIATAAAVAVVAVAQNKIRKEKVRKWESEKKIEWHFPQTNQFSLRIKIFVWLRGEKSNNAMVYRAIVDVNNVFLKVITIEQQNEKSKNSYHIL